MPGVEASRLTRQHRDAQAAIGRAVVRPVRQLALRAQTADVDRWFDSVLGRLLRIIHAGWIGSRAQANRYLREHAGLEGAVVDPVPALWSPERVITSVRVTGPVAFKRSVESGVDADAARQAMAGRLAVSAQRLTLAGGRGTIDRTVQESRVIVGWRRVTDADPCAWCAMLASRGAVYLSRASAGAVVGRGRSGVLRGSRQLGQSFHDGDECTVEPLYEDEDDPPDVQALHDEWLKATKGHSGKAAVREWRRHWDSKKRRVGEAGGDG